LLFIPLLAADSGPQAAVDVRASGAHDRHHLASSLPLNVRNAARMKRLTNPPWSSADAPIVRTQSGG
jgi:hypothetical protein